MTDSPSRPPQTWSTVAPNLFAGLIAGLMTVVASISYATLIFSGSAAGQLKLGIASALVSAAVIGILVGWRSSSPVAIAGPDANISAIMALVAAAVAGASTKTSATLNANIFAALAATSLLTGVFLYLTGRFRLGHWIRYIPYPVVGGFLAGTGWLLARGSVKVMCDVPLSLATLGKLAEQPYLSHWLPGLGFAVVLLVILRRFKHYLIMPTALAVGVLASHGILLVAGTSTTQAVQEGWLLSPFPRDVVFQLYGSLSFSAIEPSALIAGIGNLLALMIVAAIVILLNAASVELATKNDVDLDHELKASGVANIIGAPLGALTGCLALSRTLLNYKAGANSRLAGIISGGVCGAVLVLCAPVLGFFPKPILGGLLLYLGLSLIWEWVIDGWSRLSRFDYFLVVAILVTIGFWGFLPGVGIGLLASCLLFAFNYSRIGVVKHAWSGAHYHSNVERPYAEQKRLRTEGDQIRILKLQGFVFFGTAYPLLEHLRVILSTPSNVPARHIVFDFSAVTGLDSSSAMSFTKMKDLIRARGARLIFVGLSPEIRAILAEGGCLKAPPDTGSAPTADADCLELTDLDHAIGSCEEEILRRPAGSTDVPPQTIADQLAGLFPRPDLIPRLVVLLERLEAAPGQVLYRQGEPSNDLFFVESGEVTALLEVPGEDAMKRLRTMGAGTVVGEMGLYLGTRRSATVIAEKPGILYRLSADAFRKIEVEDLELASALHRFFVHLLAGRLSHANEELAHLMS